MFFVGCCLILALAVEFCVALGDYELGRQSDAMWVGTCFARFIAPLCVVYIFVDLVAICVAYRTIRVAFEDIRTSREDGNDFLKGMAVSASILFVFLRMNLHLLMCKPPHV